MVHWRQIQNSASIQKPTKYRDLKKKKGKPTKTRTIQENSTASEILERKKKSMDSLQLPYKTSKR